MENLNDVQLLLPYEIVDEPVYNAIVRQNWKITFSKQRFTSVYTKRAMGLVAAQIRKDEAVKDYYQFRSADIIEAAGITDKNEVYKKMKVVLVELTNVVFFITDEATQRIIPRHLLDTTQTGEYMCQYHNGILTLRFNPAIKPVIAQLGHYAQFELDNYMRFSSWYSMRLWELLYPFRDTGFYHVDIDEYRDLMGCGAIIKMNGEPMKANGRFKYEKYGTKHSNAVNKTLAEPLKELVGTACEFKHVVVHDETRRGKPIVRLEFTLTKRKLSDKDKIENWCMQSPDFKKAYEFMHTKWLVSDRNIVLYAASIGKKRMFELNEEWMQKQASQKRMEDVAKYCNKVFTAEGKKAIK